MGWGHKWSAYGGGGFSLGREGGPVGVSGSSTSAALIRCDKVAKCTRGPAGPRLNGPPS